MRIPWYISLLLMVCSVGITWYIRTKDMNFFPETGAEHAMEVTGGAEESSDVLLVGPPSPPSLPEDLLEKRHVIPSLEAFLDLQEKPDVLERFFSVQRAQREVEEAYLLGERLVECTGLPEEEKEEVVGKMAELLPEVRLWVCDESEVYPATLEVYGGSMKEEEQAELERRLAEAFLESSGGMISLRVLFSEGEARGVLSIGSNISMDNVIPAPVNYENVLSAFYPLLSEVISSKHEGVTLPSFSAPSPEQFKSGLTRRAWALLLDEVEKGEAEETKEEGLEEEGGEGQEDDH